jgi:hypothetical protein
MHTSSALTTATILVDRRGYSGATRLSSARLLSTALALTMLLAVTVMLLTHPAAASGRTKTVTGGTVAGRHVVNLILRTGAVRLERLTVRDPLVLQGIKRPYQLEAKDVRFRSDVDVNVDAKQSFSAVSSRFDGVMAVIQSEACPKCAFDFFADRSAFSTGLVVSGGNTIVELLRSRILFPSVIRSFDSFTCRICTVDANVTFAPDKARAVAFFDTSGTGGLTFEPGHLGEFTFRSSRLEGPIDLEAGTFGRFDVPCVASQAVLVRWEQFGDALTGDDLASAENERAAAQRLRREALCWKHHLEDNGRNADALRANHTAITLNRDHVLHPLTPDWLAAWTLELPTSYGTAPWRLLLISVLVVVACGLVYAAADPFEAVEDIAKSRPKGPLVLFAILFSVETFIPVLKVTGVKDWGWWIKSSPLRWLEALEGLIGGILTLLAGYSLASYVF